jgi:hypothetical protein
VQPEQLETELLSLLRTAYPAIEVRIAPWDQDRTRVAIRFVEPSFAGLYVQERYHRLVHLIPRSFFDQELTNTVWFELAPGERAEELRYPDEELIREITPAVLGVLAQRHAFEGLDDLLCPADPRAVPSTCAGGFQHMRRILAERGFSEDDLFDILHVLMEQGAFCDCEILTNVERTSRFGTRSWGGHGSRR